MSLSGPSTPIGESFRSRVDAATEGSELKAVASDMQAQLCGLETELLSVKKQLLRKERELENATLLVGQQKDLIKAGLVSDNDGPGRQEAMQAVSGLLSGDKPSSSIQNINLVPGSVISKIEAAREQQNQILQIATQKALSIHSTIQGILSDSFGQLSLSSASSKSSLNDILTLLSNDVDQLSVSASSQKTDFANISLRVSQLVKSPPGPNPLLTLQQAADVMEGANGVSLAQKDKVFKRCVEIFGDKSVNDLLADLNFSANRTDAGLDFNTANQLMSVVNKIAPAAKTGTDDSPNGIVLNCASRLLAYSNNASTKKPKVVGNLELFKLLAKLSPSDAGKLQKRLQPSQEIDQESLVRAISTHVDNLLQNEANPKFQEFEKLKRKLSRISGVLSELLGEEENEGDHGQRIEEQILNLNSKYQETRDYLHSYQTEAAFAIQQLQGSVKAISRACGISAVDLSSILSDPKSPEVERRFDTMEKDISRILAKVESSFLQHPPKTASPDRQFCSTREAKVIASLATALSVDPEDIADVESGIQMLCKTSHSLRHQLDESQLNLHRYISRIQNIIKAHDTRTPSERHVHVGDLNASGLSATPGLDDLEALLRQLIVKGGSIVSSKDELMDSIDLDLRAILPHVESLIGVPKLVGEGSGYMTELPDDQIIGSRARLSVTIARWKRVIEYHSQVLVNGLGPGEKVMVATIQHVVARLRSSLPQDVLLNQSYNSGIGPDDLSNNEDFTPSVSDAVAQLDCYSSLVSEWSQRVFTERQHVCATLETLCCSLPDFDKQIRPPKINPTAESNLVATCQKAAAAVASLTAKYTGLHTRMQRVATTVINCASTVDKILPGNAAPPPRSGLSASLSRRAEDIPEHVLQESLSKLQHRVAVLSQSEYFDKSSDKGLSPSDAVLSKVAIDQLRELASSAPSRAPVSELVSSIGIRVAATDSDRNLLRREGERSRALWRKLHDEVTRRLKPLIENDTSTLFDPTPESDPSHAVGIIAKVEQRHLALQKQLSSSTAELSSQKTRRLDLDSRVRGNNKTNSKVYKEITKICSNLQVTAIPTLHDEMDAPATLQLIGKEVETLLVTTEQVTQLRDDLSKRLHEAEIERAKSARLEMQRLHLLNSVRDVLHNLDMLPDATCESDSVSDSDWTAICSGVQELSSELSIGYSARKRVSSVEEILSTLLNKLSLDVDSPQRESSVPKRSPPPPPSSPSTTTTVLKRAGRPANETTALSQSQILSLSQKICQEFERVRDIAQQEPVWRQKVTDAEEGMTTISEAFRMKVGKGTSLKDIAADIATKYRELQELSASNAAEKTKIIKNNLELKQELSSQDEELADLRHELAALDEDKSTLERKLEAASMFVKYAKEMKRDAEEEEEHTKKRPKAQERSLIDDDDIYEFKEITAVKAYQSYLQLRKDKENLMTRVAALEQEIETAHLHEDFFGGLHAKLSILKTSLSEAVSMIVATDGQKQLPHRSPPPPPNNTDPSQLPTDILSHIGTIERFVNALRFEGKDLLQDIQKVFQSLKDWSGGAIGTPSVDCSTVHEGISSLNECVQHIVEESEKRDRERELIVKQREQALEMRERDVSIMSQAVPAVPLPPPPTATVEIDGCTDVERILLSVLSKLNDMIGQSPSSGGGVVGLARQIDSLTGIVASELRYLVRRILPGQSLVDALKAKIGNPTSPARAMAASEAIVSEGVRGVANQLTTLASNISSAPARECTKLLLRSAKKGDEDPLGLLASIRRLHVIIANKLDAGPKEATELRGKIGLLEAQLKGLEAEAERKELNLLSAVESEKQATQMLSIQKAQWENHKRVLEERFKKSESERKRLQQLNDEFQSALALQRNQSATGASEDFLKQSTVARRRGSGQENQRPQSTTSPRTSAAPDDKSAEIISGLQNSLEEVTQKYEEMKEFAAKVNSRLELKGKGKQEYKDKYRHALGELKNLENSREKQKTAFQHQLNTVKDQLLKLQGKGKSNRSAYQQKQVQDTRLTQGSSKKPQSVVASTAAAGGITVPQEFNFNRPRGRTGCWVCDTPGGPTKYGGTLPHHKCPQHQRDPSKAAADDDPGYSSSDDEDDTGTQPLDLGY